MWLAARAPRLEKMSPACDFNISDIKSKVIQLYMYTYINNHKYNIYVYIYIYTYYNTHTMRIQCIHDRFNDAETGCFHRSSFRPLASRISFWISCHVKVKSQSYTTNETNETNVPCRKSLQRVLPGVTRSESFRVRLRPLLDGIHQRNATQPLPGVKH